MCTLLHRYLQFKQIHKSHLHNLAIFFFFKKQKNGLKQFFNIFVDLPTEFSNDFKLLLKIDL